MSALEVLAVTAGGLVSLGVIGRTVLRPLWRAIHVMEDATPVLLDIAREFAPNGHPSLRETIDAIDRKSDIAAASSEAAAAAAAAAASTAETAKLVAETNARIVEELTSTSMAELRGIETYIHDQAHITRNALQAHVLALSNVTKQNEAIVAKLTQLEPYVKRHREGDPE